MTRQEIFDKAAGGVIKQGKRSALLVYGYQLARYHAAKDIKCPVGHLILDEFYREELEGRGLASSNTMVCDALINSGVDVKDFDILRELQIAHDKIWGTEDFMPTFISKAKQVAQEFNLEWNF